MGDKYHDLLFNHNLYPVSFINHFGVEGKHWRLESDRQKELSLRHDMVCLLLCNLELMPYLQIIKNTMSDPGAIERKRKRTESITNLLEEENIKRMRETPGTSGTFQASVSGSQVSTILSSGSSSSNEEIEEALYRFILIEGMPKPELIQNMYAKEWNINPPNGMWDIIDRSIKSFIEVKVTRNKEKAIENWRVQSLEIPNHSSLFIIDPDTGKGEWFGKTKRAKGEMKVTKFILTRREIMRNLNILDSEIQEQKNLTAHIFVSEYFNKMVAEWTKDWWVEDQNAIRPEDKLERVDRVPKAIQPTQLYDNLSKLDERERQKFIYWRGKISPEGWVHNVVMEDGSDSEIVDQFLKFVSTYEWKLGFLNENDKDISLLPNLIHTWRSGEQNTFNFNGNWKENFKEELKTLLGIGYKSSKSQLENSTVHKEYKPIELLKYHPWFDETLRRLSKPHQCSGSPFQKLEENINIDDHPLSKICGEMSKKLLTSFLSTNSAMYSSKMTNFYSRMGGAYVTRNKGKKGDTAHMAIFPIYATVSGPPDECNQKFKKKLTSGIIIRGPHHARSSTDKINFCSLELFRNDPETITYLKFQKKNFVYYNENYILLFRKNSIMREDPSYLTFNINSMFLPFNLFGVMTLENAYISPNTNMMALMNGLWDKSEYWFIERFTEGVVMSAIGTSRDEGYFAQLRKLFMLILSWRRDGTGACWDIVAYTSKVNECLIDNPLSMHFHNTIMKLLQFYGQL